MGALARNGETTTAAASHLQRSRSIWLVKQAEQAPGWEPLEPVWEMVGRFWRIQYGLESMLRNTLPMFTDEDWTLLTAGQLRTKCERWYRSLGINEFVQLDEGLQWIKQSVANRNCVAHAKLEGEYLWGIFKPINGEEGQRLEITQQWLEIAYATAWVALRMIHDLGLAVMAAEFSNAFSAGLEKIPDEELAQAERAIANLPPERRQWLESLTEPLLFPAGRPKYIARSPSP